MGQMWLKLNRKLVDIIYLTFPTHSCYSNLAIVLNLGGEKKNISSITKYFLNTITTHILVVNEFTVYVGQFLFVHFAYFLCMALKLLSTRGYPKFFEIEAETHAGNS